MRDLEQMCHLSELFFFVSKTEMTGAAHTSWDDRESRTRGPGPGLSGAASQGAASHGRRTRTPLPVQCPLPSVPTPAPPTSWWDYVRGERAVAPLPGRSYWVAAQVRTGPGCCEPCHVPSAGPWLNLHKDCPTEGFPELRQATALCPPCRHHFGRCRPGVNRECNGSGAETYHLPHRTRQGGDQNFLCLPLDQLSKVPCPTRSPLRAQQPPPTSPLSLGVAVLRKELDGLVALSSPTSGWGGVTGEGTSSCPHPGRGL